MLNNSLKILLTFVALTALASCSTLEKSRNVASDTQKQMRLRITGSIFATTEGSVIMQNAFLAEITMPERNSDQNNALASEQRVGHYQVTLDSLGYTIGSRVAGASRCVGSTEAVLYIDTNSIRDYKDNEDQTLFGLDFYFSTAGEKSYSLIRRFGKTSFSAKSKQGVILNDATLSLASTPLKVLKQLPGCTQELKNIWPTLIINKIEVIQN